jgi:hypothetical protein
MLVSCGAVTPGWLVQATSEFYIAPAWAIENDIYRKHTEYLRNHGGHRALNDKSKHHRTETDRVALWHGRWDLLRIFHENPA